MARIRLTDPVSVREKERIWALKGNYGITPEEFTALLDGQAGKCAICQAEWGQNLADGIDHDHKTGKIRGLLCARCNAGLGMFRDNPTSLKSAIEYLERSKVTA